MDILLADNRKVRLALRVLLEQTAGLTIVGEAANAQDLLAQTSAARPDLVLLDWALPGLHDNGTLRALRQICPDTSVIVLSGRPEAQKPALAAGASAFVSKVEPPERLLAAIEEFRHE
jgi:DNA-binding NarL/FixJ family response regulator